ncbi:multi-sensor signal transduction histidine kinase [Duganella sp. CF517]|uniref:ATP-binding protein n=1 Tax=Duganella sp. CF517 TaxID=1881038 RepID=UPI0008B8F2D7|nr:ATP-binding protein [Duganella sp. CF517]SEO04406.1 multi-sensor signal transduction histidine kinase [Duganella sp. CF517]
MTHSALQTDSPWMHAGQPYSIKRHGLTLSNCDSEPVQTPGCVQAHGALLVLRLADLTVLQASENSEDVLGHAPAALLGCPVGAVLGPEGEGQLRTFLAAEKADRNPLYLLTLPVRGAVPPLDVTVHTINGVAVLEFEATGQSTGGEPDYYALVKTTVSRLQTADTLRQFCDIAAEEVRILTGMDRVMVYKFHQDGHGEVFAESRRAELDPWLGLHYPAEDIPKPARDVFTKIWIRPTPDVDGGLSEMVPLLNPDDGQPLTMTYCALRGASLMYTEYLKNMTVTAGLTMPIRQADELWGLIACHHYAGPRFIPYQVRAACEFLAQVVSLQYKAASEREHFVYQLKLDGVHQQLVAQAAHEGGLSAVTDGDPVLLDGIAAGGAALYHSDRWWLIGTTPTEAELDALATWLFARPEFGLTGLPLYVTEALGRDYAAGAAFADVASGLLAFPLSRTGRNLMLWFRPETIHTIHWGGNPHEKPTVLGPHGSRLTPRVSFDLFAESVQGRSLPWLAVEIEAAARLRVLLMELVVNRADLLANLNADLTRSNDELDAFAYVASHDLKEPLRGIHKYAHQLLEDAAVVEEEHRKKLEGLMRLTVRMDGLLDSLLHFSRVGRTALQLEETDLNEVLAEAVEMVGARAADGQSEVHIPRPLPRVRCDRVRYREILVNLLSNAFKYTDQAHKRIEVGYIDVNEDHLRTGCPDGSARHAIFYVKDNGIGIHAKHHDQVFKMFKRLHGRNEYGGGTGAGLSIVKRLVERHGGQVWLDSAPGAGTTFYFTLPFQE